MIVIFLGLATCDSLLKERRKFSPAQGVGSKRTIVFRDRLVSVPTAVNAVQTAGIFGDGLTFSATLLPGTLRRK